MAALAIVFAQAKKRDRPKVPQRTRIPWVLPACEPAEQRGRGRAGWQLQGTPEDLKGPKAARLQPGQPGIYRKPLLRLGNGTSYGMKVGPDPSHLN